MGGKYVEERVITYTADEAMGADLFVRIDPTSTSTPIGVKLCMPHQRPHGVTCAAQASGDLVAVRVFTQYASMRATAGAAISKGARIYPGPSGKVYPYGVQPSIGIAFEASTATGAVIEWGYDPLVDDPNLDILEDDFSDYTDGTGWTVVATNTGTATPTDGRPSRLALTPSDGSVANNDEIYLKSDLEQFKFVAAKPIYFRARVMCTEGATDDVNLIIGLKDAVAADSVLDDGGGPAASYSGALFFKVDGQTVWQAEVSDGAEQDTDTNVGTRDGTDWETLEFVWWPTSSALFDCYFYHNGVHGGTLVSDAGDEGLTDYGSATEMEVCYGAKNGADTTVETLLLDAVRVVQFK